MQAATVPDKFILFLMQVRARLYVARRARDCYLVPIENVSFIIDFLRQQQLSRCSQKWEKMSGMVKEV